jgi:hypothetical protein
MAKNPWAYPVSETTRRREVEENTCILRQVDAWLATGLALPSWCTESDAAVVDVALTSEAYAAALGVSVEDAAALADYCDRGDIAWLHAAREVEVRGWYKRGEATYDRLVSMYGRHVEIPAEAKKSRAAAVRRLRTAKNALGLP